ncbi:MAG: glutaredoxin family protein [Raoultibacter sp.]|jgi:glutathione S-transferase
MAYIEDLTLYYKKDCEFCDKIMSFLEETHITLDKRDVLQPGNQNDLIKIGGKKQVPCLVAHSKALYESDDIITYLKSIPN